MISERKVFNADAIKFKEENKIDYFIETSAKKGDSTDVFIEAAKILQKDYVNNSYSRSRTGSHSSRMSNSKRVTNINIKKNEIEDGRLEDSSSGKCCIF